MNFLLHSLATNTGKKWDYVIGAAESGVRALCERINSLVLLHLAKWS